MFNPTPESGKHHPATSGIWNPANLTSGTSLNLLLSSAGRQFQTESAAWQEARLLKDV